MYKYIYIYCSFHPCCSLTCHPSSRSWNLCVRQTLTWLRRAPGVWAGGYVSAIAYWLPLCGQSIWAWPPWQTACGRQQWSGKGVAVRPFAWRRDWSRRGGSHHHIGSGAPVENGGIQGRTCQKLLQVKELARSVIKWLRLSLRLIPARMTRWSTSRRWSLYWQPGRKPGSLSWSLD